MTKRSISSRVLRLKAGDAIAVFDGQGREALARIASVTSRRVSVQVVEPRAAAPEPRVARDARAGAAEERQDGSRHSRCRDARRRGRAAVREPAHGRAACKAVARAAGRIGGSARLSRRSSNAAARSCRRYTTTKEFAELSAIDGERHAADVRRARRRGVTSPI